MFSVLALMGAMQLQALTIAAAFSIGYLAHLLADAMTVHGVPLLWPLDFDIHLLPRPLRIRTGSFAEYAVIVALGIGMVRLWMNA
jgi:membrane-bound metal-dependent hydrolase YbcI (DUF457 family)